jgi:tetratricopeptide (TPR) repeat protein
VAAQEVIGADLANVWAAWEWAAGRAEVAILERMLAGLARWHELQGLPGQAADLLERAAERLRGALAQAATPDPAVQRLLGFILVENAMALNWQGSYPRALPLLEEARTLALATGSPHLEWGVAYTLGWLLGRQRDLRGAIDSLQQALALARVGQRPSLEADTLGTLGEVDLMAADYPQAHRYLERALALYRAQHDRLGEMAVTGVLGTVAHARGDFDRAESLIDHALRLNRLLGWRLGEIYMLHALGQVNDEGWGRHVAAEDLFAQDLRITRRTGDRTREGFALAGLGRNVLYQGDLERAGTLFDQALSLSRAVTSRASAAMALRGQSLLAHYQGDDQRARRCAEEARELARAAGLRREERLALRLLGHALLGLGELPAALVAYQQVAELDEALGVSHLHAETVTDLVRVELARGDTARAAARVAIFLPMLEQGTLVGLEEPVLAYLSCYQVLRAVCDPRAEMVLAAGHAFLQERATQFADAQRARFLGNLPAHRDLLAAWNAHDGWTSGDMPRVRIMRAD